MYCILCEIGLDYECTYRERPNAHLPVRPSGLRYPPSWDQKSCSNHLLRHPSTQGQGPVLQIPLRSLIPIVVCSNDHLSVILIDLCPPSVARVVASPRTQPYSYKAAACQDIMMHRHTKRRLEENEGACQEEICRKSGTAEVDAPKELKTKILRLGFPASIFLFLIREGH
jgi:hypothetical protein